MLLKVLQKAPDRRYATVEQFGEDVRRHLAGLPITARADSVAYRIGTFVRRHAVGVGATLAVAVALVAALAVSLWQADRARQEAAKASQMNAFLQEMLASADPSNEGRDVKVADVLDDDAERAGEDQGSLTAVRSVRMRSVFQMRCLLESITRRSAEPLLIGWFSAM